MIPLSISDHIFKQYDSLIKDFLWAGRKLRFKLSKMYAPRDKGGLGLPDVRLYSWSFEIVKIAKHWSGTVNGLEWAAIEKALAMPFHPISVITQESKDK